MYITNNILKEKGAIIMSKNAARGIALTMVEGAYLADNPTFFPKGYDGHQKDCLAFSVVVNEGQNEDGSVEYKSTLPIKLWGPIADKMSYMLEKGTCVNIMGSPKSYMKPTGTVHNGKAQYINTIYFAAQRIKVIGESQKKRDENLSRNVATLIQNGQIPPQLAGVLTAQNLLGHIAPTMAPFTAAVSMQSGMHGNAKVWTKDRGSWIEAKGTPAPAAGMTFVPGIGNVNMSDPAVAAALAQLKTSIGAVAVTNGTAAPVEIVPVVTLDEAPNQAMEASASEDDNLFS